MHITSLSITTPVSKPMSSLSEHCFRLLELPDDTLSCLSALEPAFLEFLTRTPTASCYPREYRWVWEPVITPSLETRLPAIDKPSSPARICKPVVDLGAVKPGSSAIIYHPSYQALHGQAQQEMAHVVTLSTLRGEYGVNPACSRSAH